MGMYSATILPEFEVETANTRRVIAQVPDEKYSWKSHPKSNTIGWNVSHLVEIVSWVPGVLHQTEWETYPEGGEPYRTQLISSREEALAQFDEHVRVAKSALAEISDEAVQVPWSLLAKGKPLFTHTRAEVIRLFVMNHQIHHRAILCSYLRLNDIPVPGMYGPSGDE